MNSTTETVTTFNLSNGHQFTNSGISDMELDPVKASSSLLSSSVDAVSTCTGYAIHYHLLGALLDLSLKLIL